MSKVRTFVIEIHEEVISKKHLDDLEGELRDIIGLKFDLDADVGFCVVECTKKNTDRKKGESTCQNAQ